jgi:hypothetical protein
MHFDELFGDVEPESGAAELPGYGGVDLLEFPEDVFQLVFGNANAGIRDLIEQVFSLLLDC